MCPHPPPLACTSSRTKILVLRYQHSCRERVVMMSGERTNITRLPPETVSSQACTAARRMEGRSGTEFKTDDKYKVTKE